MSELEIFQNLFKVAGTSKDKNGVVAACLVLDGKVVVASASADDGIRHAEDLVLEKAGSLGIKIIDKMALYTTLEPCSHRDPAKSMTDCTTLIIRSGIKNVIYGANDPEDSKDFKLRCEKAGIKCDQVSDPEIISRSVDIFNSTVSKDSDKI
jgi:pyrimidine deaminase RibD-like protein